ncbi:hypothetical protein K438DRAFT_1977734 [Mycena galopus ATCC 62051]|nr:hypothetical protein K438DRAFT_1977734 [Mycena galopus ATCC 62051]
MTRFIFVLVALLSIFQTLAAPLRSRAATDAQCNSFNVQASVGITSALLSLGTINNGNDVVEATNILQAQLSLVNASNAITQIDVSEFGDAPAPADVNSQVLSGIQAALTFMRDVPIEFLFDNSTVSAIVNATNLATSAQQGAQHAGASTFSTTPRVPLTTSHPAHSVTVPAPISTSTVENRISELQYQLEVLRSRTRAIAGTPYPEYSRSAPSPTVSRRPPQSHVDLASVYHQQQQDIDCNETHEFIAPPIASVPPIRTPGSELAPPSKNDPFPPPAESSPLASAYPQSHAPHAVPHVVSPSFLRAQQPQPSRFELVHAAEPQSRTASLEKLSQSSFAHHQWYQSRNAAQYHSQRAKLNYSDSLPSQSL